MNAYLRALEGLQGPSAETIAARKKLISLEVHPSSRLFQKKPVIIEAVQLKWATWNEMCDFLGPIINEQNPCRNVETYSDRCGELPPYIEITIPTLEGDHIARHGDWIIKGVSGEFYPCRNDIFEVTYAKVDNLGLKKGESDV